MRGHSDRRIPRVRSLGPRARAGLFYGGPVTFPRRRIVAAGETKAPSRRGGASSAVSETQAILWFCKNWFGPVLDSPPSETQDDWQSVASWFGPVLDSPPSETSGDKHLSPQKFGPVLDSPPSETDRRARPANRAITRLLRGLQCARRADDAARLFGLGTVGGHGGRRSGELLRLRRFLFADAHVFERRRFRNRFPRGTGLLGATAFILFDLVQLIAFDAQRVEDDFAASVLRIAGAGPGVKPSIEGTKLTAVCFSRAKWPGDARQAAEGVLTFAISGAKGPDRRRSGDAWNAACGRR